MLPSQWQQFSIGLFQGFAKGGHHYGKCDQLPFIILDACYIIWMDESKILFYSNQFDIAESEQKSVIYRKYCSVD